MTLRSRIRACRPRAARLALVAGLGLAGMAPKCPPVPECPAGQHLGLIGGKLACIADPQPTPPATPTPAPPTPSPTSVPTPEQPPATPTPTATPGPTATPVVTPTPAPTPKPTPSACERDCAWRLEADQRHGHLVKTASGLYCDDADGKPPCFNARCEHVTPQGGVLHSACDWMGLEACCAPSPTPTPAPTPTPSPTTPGGPYECGGVRVERIGLNFNRAPASADKCRFDKTALVAEGDCILTADASVRGPKGSAPAVPSTEAHLGWLPGCHWVVRPRWEQRHAPDMAVDIGVRHWRADEPATSIASWDVTEPPYFGAPYGSLARFEYDSAFGVAEVQIRACWPPDVPDAVCSPWYTVRHR